MNTNVVETPKAENILLDMSYYAYVSLSLFVFMSLSLSALYHILVIVPGVYFTYKAIKEKHITFPKSIFGLLAICVAAALSVIFNREDMGGLKGIMKIKYFLIAALAISPAVYHLQKGISRKKINFLFNGFFISTAIANIAGLIAYVTEFNYLRWKKACNTDQACGMYGMTITYGYNVELLALLLLGLFIYRKKLKGLFNEKLLVLATICAHAGLYFSFSRGAILGYLLAFPMTFYMFGKKKIIGLYAVSVVLLAGLLILIATGVKPKVLSRYTLSFSDNSNMERIGQFQAAIAAFQESPIFGIGFRNFEKHSLEIKKKYGFWDKFEFKGHAHNNYLEFLAGCGILGLVALLLFHFFWGMEILRSDPLVVSLLMPVFLGFAISGFFQSTIIDGENMFFIMGLYAVFTALVIAIKNGNLKITEE